MGHDPDPAAEADRLRGLVREAHEAEKDLRRTIREALGLARELAARFEDIASREVRDMTNQLQVMANDYAAALNANVGAARQEIAQHLFDARVEYDEAADNFRVVFRGATFAEGTPPPYPERMTPP